MIDVKSCAVPAVLVAAALTLTFHVPVSARTPEEEHHDIPAPRGIGLNLFGTLSSPRGLFADNYKPWLGLGYSIVVSSRGDETTGVHTTWTAFSNYSRDVVRLENTTTDRFDVERETSAIISSFQFGAVTGVPVSSSRGYTVSIFSGGGVGGSRFSIDDAVFDSLGQSTLTEIKSERDKTNLSTNRQFGIELFASRGVSLQYSYNFMEIDRTWKVFHSLVSSTANNIVVDGVPWLVRSMLPEDVRNSRGAHATAFVYKLAACIIWDHNTRERGNWPYRDEPSMRYHRQMFGLTYYLFSPKKQPPK
jgi:hypothetical protein